MSLVLKKIGRVWHIHGTVDGRRVRQSARTGSRPHADAIRRALEQDMLDRAHLGNRAATLADAVIYYLEQGGERRFLAPILDRWGATRLGEITPIDVSAFASERYGHLRPATVKRELYTPLNAVMRAANRAGLVGLVRFDAPKVKPAPAAYADEAWLAALLACANPRLALAVLLLTTTGARVGEACRLVWGDVDLARGVALLRQTKSGRSRQVGLAAGLVALLAAARPADATSEDRVLGYADRWSVNQALRRAARRAGIRVLSSHQVGRHAFAARLLADGASLKAVQEAGGWASIQIVAGTYGHLEASHVDAAVRATGESLLARLAPARQVSGKIAAEEVFAGSRKNQSLVDGSDG